MTHDEFDKLFNHLKKIVSDDVNSDSLKHWRFTLRVDTNWSEHGPVLLSDVAYIFSIIRNCAPTEALQTLWNNANVVLLQKAKEYATDADRLHNFNSALNYGVQPVAAAFHFMLKHIISIDDMLKKWKLLENRRSIGEHIDPSEEIPYSLCIEKCGDAFNYLILLIALHKVSS